MTTLSIINGVLALLSIFALIAEVKVQGRAAAVINIIGMLSVMALLLTTVLTLIYAIAWR